MALLLILPPLISLSFYYFLGDIEAYAGLSGVLHGMFTAIAIVHLLYRKERMVCEFGVVSYFSQIDLGKYLGRECYS